MADYPFEMQLVVDPDNPSNVVRGGAVSIYDPADTAGATLLALKDPSGLPLANPLMSNAYGFISAHVAAVPQTRWKSGTFEGYFSSFEGLRAEAVAARADAVAARLAAEGSEAAAADAASRAGAPTEAQVDAAILRAKLLTEANLTGKLAGLGYNVLDEGAVGDGDDVDGTDNTGAFQRTMDKAEAGVAFGTTMIIPALPDGLAFHVKGTIEPRSGVRVVAYGAVVRKYSHSGNYSVFSARSGTRTGYGASVKNFTVEGLTFRGSFKAGALSGCGVTLHHADQVTFYKCRWVEAIITGHAIDSMGTRGLVVDDCTFEGFLPQTNREYTEAVQLDFSKISSVINDAPASYDGLPTINATVRNSRFTQLTIGGTTYPAPNPMGCHTRVAGRWHENILFENNVVEGCHAPVTTDAFALTCKGWLHFFCTRGVKSRNNRFINVGGREARVFGAHAISSGTALADVGVSGAASTAMTPMPMQDFTSEGDTFIGFTNDAIEALIRITGTPATFARDVKVIRPVVKDSWSTPGVSGNKGTELVHLEDTIGALVDGSSITAARSLGYFNNVSKLNITGGTLKDLGAYIARFVTCTEVNVNGVHVDTHGGGWYFHTNCKRVDIGGGSIVGGRADAILKKDFTFSSTDEFSVHNVSFPKDATNGYTSAIDALASSVKGHVYGNFTEGWTDATLVNRGTGSEVTIGNAAGGGGITAVTFDNLPSGIRFTVNWNDTTGAYNPRPTRRADLTAIYSGPEAPVFDAVTGAIDGIDKWEDTTP